MLSQEIVQRLKSKEREASLASRIDTKKDKLKYREMSKTRMRNSLST